MAAVQLVRFGSNPPPVESGAPADVVSGNPATLVQNYFTDRSGQFFSGIWECTPGKWPVSYSESEFCAILEGSAILTGADGKSETFKAGDAFVIPSGFTGFWETVTPLRKWYAIFEAKKD